MWVREHGAGVESSLGLWEESFDGHPDSKPDGPTSVGMDVYFPGGFQVCHSSDRWMDDDLDHLDLSLPFMRRNAVSVWYISNPGNVCSIFCRICVPRPGNMELERTAQESSRPDVAALKYVHHEVGICLLYTSPSPRDKRQSRMPSSA